MRTADSWPVDHTIPFAPQTVSCTVRTLHISSVPSHTHMSSRSGPCFEALSGHAFNRATTGWRGPCWHEVLGSSRGHELHVGPEDLVHQQVGIWVQDRSSSVSP